jgi:hypothetical protein
MATQGVLSFIIFKFLGNWEVKKILHPISFFLVILVFIIKSSKKIRITTLDIIFFGYFLILFVVMLFNISSLESAYIVFREVYFVFILIFVFSQVEICQELWNNVLSLIFYLLILNSIFIVITNYLGPEEYMKMITGRYQWGIDPEYKFKITNFNRFWRSPALIGDAASVGYFSVIGYLLMDQNSKFKNKKYLALFPLIFSFVRSAYVVFIIYEFFKFFTKKKNLKILGLIFKIGVPLLLITGLVLSKYNILSLESLQERFYLWGNKTEIEYNYFFGGSIGKVGGGARGQGFISTIDSYWLFMLFSSGLIGISLIILFVYQKSLKTNKSFFILISFLFAGFFVSLTQSLIFLALFPLLFVKIKNKYV